MSVNMSLSRQSHKPTLPMRQERGFTQTRHKVLLIAITTARSSMTSENASICAKIAGVAGREQRGLRLDSRAWDNPIVKKRPRRRASIDNVIDIINASSYGDSKTDCPSEDAVIHSFTPETNTE